MTQDEYNALIEQIRNAATQVNDGYKNTTNGATTLCDVNQYIEYNPNITIVRNGNGDVIGYDYKYTSPENPNMSSLDVDSNNDSGIYGDGGRNRSSYYAGTINTDETSTDKANGIDGVVSGYISPEWGLVSALSKFGKSVYDTASGAIINTTDSISELLEKIGTHGGKSLRVLYGVDDNCNTTMYMDADTIGALAIAARDDGYLTGNVSHIDTTPIDYPIGESLSDKVVSYMFSPYNVTFRYRSGDTDSYNVFCMAGYGMNSYIGANCYVTLNDKSAILLNCYGCFYSSGNVIRIVLASNNPNFIVDKVNLVTLAITDGVYNYITASSNNHYTYTYNDKTVYYYNAEISYMNKDSCIYEYSNDNAFDVRDIAWYMVYGEHWQGGAGIDGIVDQIGAINPVDAITGADPHIVGENLVTQYPDLMGTPIQVVVMDDSCNEHTINYYSVPISYSPTNVSIDVPVTGTLQLSPSFNPTIELPDINIENYIDQIADQLSGSGAGRDNTNTDPETGTPSVLPPIIPGTGTGITPISINPNADVQALWHVYNPLPGELTAFGGWLWSTDIIDQIIRMFVNPMESVIGVHAIYAQPPTGNMSPIVVGTITSTVNSKIVTSQYFTLDCGEIWLTEYFGNVFDYAPYTKVSLFLPFIGIVDLNVADVMRSKISIKYNIDVYTGACIAMVNVIRDGVGGVLYQYPGNCGVEYPISSASYSRMLQSVMAAGATAIGGIASGGAMLPAIGSAISTLASGNVSVQRSGTFSGNPGAMGPKKPYLIITRPQINMADNYAIYDGIGSNYTSMLKDVSGYVRCKEVHLNIPGAFANELSEIETLLKSGVFISGGLGNSGGGSGEITQSVIPLSVNENGVYNVSDGVIGYNPVRVNVPNHFTSFDENKIVVNGALISQVPYPNAINNNGTYDTTLYDSITINVSGGGSGDLSMEYCDYADFIGNSQAEIIKLPFTVNANYSIECTFKLNTVINMNAVFGSGGNYTRPHLTVYNNKWYCSTGGNDLNFGTADTNKHTITLNKNNAIYFDGNEVLSNLTSQSFSDKYWVAGRSDSNGYLRGRIYSYKIVDNANDTIICEILPAKINKNNITIINGMFDTINNVFYSNEYIVVSNE